jgi:hypothetical protein
VLDADLGRVLDLLRRTAQDFAQTAGRYRTGRADLALAADLGSRGSVHVVRSRCALRYSELAMLITHVPSGDAASRWRRWRHGC